MVQILEHTPTNWLLIMHGWPCLSNQALCGALPLLLPRYLQQELSRHVLRNIARFRLHAHTRKVETGCWQILNRLSEKCDLHDVQDK